MSNIHVLAPAPAFSMIEEHGVTIERLCSLITGAVIENEIQDNGDIYANDGVNPPFWIKVDATRKLICFFTYYPPDELEASLSVGKILAIINSINAQLVLVQFYWHRDELWGVLDDL